MGNVGQPGRQPSPLHCGPGVCPTVSAHTREPGKTESDWGLSWQSWSVITQIRGTRLDPISHLPRSQEFRAPGREQKHPVPCTNSEPRLFGAAVPPPHSFSACPLDAEDNEDLNNGGAAGRREPAPPDRCVQESRVQTSSIRLRLE